MSRARPVLPNTTYAETMRTLSQELRFAGTVEERKEISRIYLYSLAHAANKYCIEVHGFNLNDDHSHLQHTDLLCNDPAFRQLKNSLVARAMNAFQGRRGPFWSPDRCIQVLADEGAQIDTYAYILANPVKHGLVPEGDLFPGPRSRPSDIGRELTIKKPKSLFREKHLPDEVKLKLTAPPALRHLPREGAIAALQLVVDERETRFREHRAARDESYLGVSILLDTAPTRRARAKHNEDDGYSTASGRPRYIKCADRKLGVALRNELKEFRIAYTAAREAFKTDKRTVFPHGTWRLPYLEKARIAASPMTPKPPALEAPRST